MNGFWTRKWVYTAVLIAGFVMFMVGFPSLLSSIATRGGIGNFFQGLIITVIALIIVVFGFNARSRSDQKSMPVFPSIFIPIIFAIILYVIGIFLYLFLSNLFFPPY